MYKLNLPPDQALKLVETIGHKSCLSGIPRQWRTTADGHVAAQSILWLFCWAKTGMNSPAAAEIAKSVFNQLLPFTFEYADNRLSHAYARGNRYVRHDIEQELAEMLDHR